MSLTQILNKLDHEDGCYLGRIGSIEIEIYLGLGDWESIVRTEGISFVAVGATPEEALVLALEELC